MNCNPAPGGSDFEASGAPWGCHHATRQWARNGISLPGQAKLISTDLLARERLAALDEDSLEPDVDQERLLVRSLAQQRRLAHERNAQLTQHAVGRRMGLEVVIDLGHWL